MRVNNLEFVRNSEGNRNAEIVAWSKDSTGKEFRYTILWWIKDSEGYNIAFVGDRPLKVDDQDVLWNLMDYGQTVLTAEYTLMDRINY